MNELVATVHPISQITLAVTFAVLSISLVIALYGHPEVVDRIERILRAFRGREK